MFNFTNLLKRLLSILNPDPIKPKMCHSLLPMEEIPRNIILHSLLRKVWFLERQNVEYTFLMSLRYPDVQSCVKDMLLDLFLQIWGIWVIYIHH